MAFEVGPVPASDIKVTFCPPGPTSRTLTSSPQPCEKLFKVTVTLLTVPPIPPTLITDGYGDAAPAVGIVIALGLANGCVPTKGGLTLTTNVSIAVLVPSLTVTVIVEVPV